MDKDLEALKEMYMNEIKKITKKPELTPADGDAACKALSAIEKIYTVCGLMCEEEEAKMAPSYSSRSLDRVIEALEDLKMGTPEHHTRSTINKAISGL